jgi:hypothetical protein
MDRGDEAITASGHVRDVSAAAAAIAEQLPQFRDRYPEAAFAHYDVWPGSRHQFALSNHLAGGLCERDKDIECSAAEVDRLIASQKDALRRDQTVWSERDDVTGSHGALTELQLSVLARHPSAYIFCVNYL